MRSPFLLAFEDKWFLKAAFSTRGGKIFDEIFLPRRLLASYSSVLKDFR
jgi:hypothetical protein